MASTFRRDYDFTGGPTTGALAGRNGGIEPRRTGAAAARELRMAAESRPDLAGLRILVVEDWLLVADEIQWMLEQLGCEVVGPVPRLSLALSLIKRVPIDGAILDVNVGDEPVFPVADQLREHNVPFIFATGYDRGAFPAEYADYPRLSKPFDLRELREIMAEHLRPHSNMC